MSQGRQVPGRVGQCDSREGAQGPGHRECHWSATPVSGPKGGQSGAYRVLAVMTQVIAPNEECDQLPVFLQVDFLRGQKILGLGLGGGTFGGASQARQPPTYLSLCITMESRCRVEPPSP